jgi:hypothetical protein
MNRVTNFMTMYADTYSLLNDTGGKLPTNPRNAFILPHLLLQDKAHANMSK